MNTLIISVFSLSTFFLTCTDAATFYIQNSCRDTIWAAAVPGGGRRLESGQTWTISIPPSTTQGRIWGRTGCDFDASGKGKCQTGDCDGVLQCQGFGTPPNTLAEFSLSQFNGLDFFDVSVVDGFNVPIEFSPISGCTTGTRCSYNITAACPTVLLTPGGCNDPCTVFKTDQYCCDSGSRDCQPTNFSRFFKQRCPDAYSYAQDDQTSTFTCPGGTNYRVVFCPGDDESSPWSESFSLVCG